MKEDLFDVLRKLEAGVSLSSTWYTDAQIAEEEIHKIFRRGWQYIGPVFELKNQGDFITGTAGGIPVVIVRNEGGLQGFVNVCRHRRHEVMKGCGNTKIMQCAYHAWTYDLKGCLKAAPRSEQEQAFQLADYSLLSLRTETLGPFVFVNADPEALPVASCFGPVLDLIADSGVNLDSLVLWRRESWQSEANWKTVLENYLECYHCPVAHPSFSAAIDVDQDKYKLTTSEWLSSQIGSVRGGSLDGDGRPLPYDIRGDVHQAQYHFLWPNVTISINPGFPNLAVDVWLPNGPGSSYGFSEQYFAPNVDEQWAQDMYEFNKRVGEEDDALTTSVQRSLSSGLPAEGRLLLNSEKLLLHFQRLVVRSFLSCEASVV